MDELPTRRHLLAFIGSTGVGASTGCLGEFSESDTTETDNGTGPATPSPEITVSDVDCDPSDYPSLATKSPEGAWSLPRGNQRRTGANPDVEPLGFANTDQLKATELFSDSSVSLPVVADGVVYLTDNDLTSYAIDVKTGERVWTVETEANSRFPPVVTRDTVYFSGYEATCRAIERESGELRWRTQLDTPQGSGRTPIVVGDTLIVGHSSGVQDEVQSWYTALNVQCGSERWSIEFEHERPRGLATDGTTVYAATDNHLYAVDPDDGTEHWRAKVTDNTLEGPPALADETVILKDGGNLYALSTEDGSVRWTTRGGLAVPRPPTVTSDSVYAVEGGTEDVHALDIETGEIRWTYTGDIMTPLAVVPERLYALETSDGGGRFVALDMATGNKHAQTAITRVESLEQIAEVAVTSDGLFTHSDRSEGGNPNRIHRFTPD